MRSFYIKFTWKMRSIGQKNNPEKPKPVAVFAWKLLDGTELCLSKIPNFLENLQSDVECFYKHLEKLKKTLKEFVYEEETQTIENTGYDTEFLEAFLRNSV